MIKYIEYHANNPPIEVPKPLPFFAPRDSEMIDDKEFKDIVGEWDAKFVKRDYDGWLKLAAPADKLDIRPLLKLCFDFFGYSVGNRTVEEARKFYRISTKTYTEEEIIQKKKSEEWRWIFEEIGETSARRKRLMEEQKKKADDETLEKQKEESL